MKILHATPYFAPAFVYGGPPRSVLGLCRGLARAGADVLVVTTNANGDTDLAVRTDDFTDVDGIRVRYLRRAFPRRYFGVRGFREASRSLLPGTAVVHLHGCWNALTWRTAWACRRARVPYVVSPRGMLTNWSLQHSGLKKQLALEIVERRVLSGAALIHATTEAERRAIEDVGVRRPIVVVPNGIDPSSLVADSHVVREFRSRFAIDERDVVVLYLGRLHEKKGIDTLAEAVRLARSRTPEVKLIVAGQGDPRFEALLHARFAGLVQSKSLHFTGHLDGSDRAAAFAASDIFALTSHSENFALSVGEAMATGLPVVVSRECPWPQIDTWIAGRWVDNDVAAIAHAIDELARDPALRRRLGENGRAGVATHLTWDGVAAQMLALYARSFEQAGTMLDPVTLRA